MIIDEVVVDYLPFNDIWWNVLPNKIRIFNTYWKGFPYRTYDKEWKLEIKYWTPDEYYSKQNIENKKFLMPWEKIKVRISEKKIKALMEVSYKDIEWKDVNFKSAEDFSVTYREKYIGINPYFILLVILLLIIIIIILFIKSKVWYRCIHCNKKINKNMKICLYCGRKQTKKNKKITKKI